MTGVQTCALPILSSQCSMTVSSQCTMALVITILQNSCHHNVPEFLSSQCSMALVITMLHDRVITMPHGPGHHNAPDFFSSHCSMTLSSQCSMAFVITMLQNSCHHKRGLSLVAASGGCSSLRCAGFSWWLLSLRSTGSRHAGFSSCGSRALERRLSSCGARA